MRRNRILVTLFALIACACCAVIMSGGWLIWRTGRTLAPMVGPILTEVLASPTPSPVPVIVLTPVPTPPPGGESTLERLANAVIPPRNLRELGERLKGIPDIPETVSRVPANHALGDEVEFNVINTETHEAFKITATLVYSTENVYFFAENGVRVDEKAVQNLVDDFQNKTYPTNREFFGSEWNPGVDGDPHLYILYTRGLGSSGFTATGGYYLSLDEYSSLAHEYSNEKEIFYINADFIDLGNPTLPGILAHEFQHMIHWHQDINEETWMNEGAAMLAELINGYQAGGYAEKFLDDPDVQLNAWSDTNIIPHYGAAYLFLTYFLDRFGREATQALVADPANGLRAVDATLAALEAADPSTGQPITAADLFADWVIANYLGDAGVADGRYAYHVLKNAPRMRSPTETFTRCPVAAQPATVHQFAADYYRINCGGAITIHFTGSQQVQVIPAAPHGGRYAFWSHRDDESDTTLTRAFDLTGLASATLRYWAWWDIEENFDYAYLEVSMDGGRTWKILRTPSGTDDNPNGNNFGWGYTGKSGGGGAPQWVEESVDLSEYTGRKVLIRFEYVTDTALTHPSFMLDDLAIPELNFTADFEQEDGGWEAAGFVRMDNLLPQTFVVQVIRLGTQTTVERVPLDESNQGALTLTLAAGEDAVLVVSGTTPFTTEVASYQFEIK
jgi:hypothetical protein